MTGRACPKPEPRPQKQRKPLRSRTRIKPRNEKRAAKMHARNFPTRPTVEPFCIIARRLAAYQAAHGAKMQPSGWLTCIAKIDAAHATHNRGMGGVNSGASDVVYLCRAHHDELGHIGRAAFETRYGVDLAHEAARVAAGENDPLPPE